MLCCGPATKSPTSPNTPNACDIMPLNALTDEIRKGADRVHVWFNVILGYCVAASLPFDRTWRTDPLFATVRAFPHSQTVWAGSLAAATTIYAVGSFLTVGKPHRGTIVIIGALGCFAWNFAFSIGLERQNYIDPTHTSNLWPLLLFFLALLYGHRVVLYANAFTGTRWSLNPFQLYAVSFLMLLSLTQIVVGVSPVSVQAQFDRPTQLSLAGANFIGALLVMVGLHMRRLETGLWIELWGYASLTATMFFFIFTTVGHVVMPISTLGFTLNEAFAFASLHRAIQIAVYKRSRRVGSAAQDKLGPMLGHSDTDTVRRIFKETEHT